MALPLFAQGAFAASPNDTPETIARKRALIAAMMPKFGSAKFVGEGIGQLATGVVIGRQNKKLDAAEAAGRQSAAELFDRLIGGAGNTSYSSSGGGTPSGTWTPAPPPPSPVDVATQGMDVAKAGGLSFGDLPKADPGVMGGGKEKLGFGSAVMSPQEMLIEGARRRGLDPVDVATAISYETGGKFDPMLAGPTTQWGTHRGLIQFGEPQAQQHGVDFTDPTSAWRSQLDPNSGAVWSYLDGAGVKSGMGLDQIYSAINAGSVGRMGASDANNGGAPGTVADKVASMGPHREKAAAFLGGTWTPDPNAPQGQTTTVSTKGTGGGISTNDLLAAMANPWLDPQQRAILTGMYEDQVRQADPMYQMQVRKAELELAQLENPTQQPPEDFTTRMFTLNALGIDPQSDEGKVYLMTGKLPEDPASSAPAAFTALDMQAQAAGLVPGTPEYQAFMRNGGGAGTPAAFTALDLQAKAAGFEPGTPEYQEFMATRGAGLAAEARTRGEAAAEAEIAAPADIASAETTLSYISSLRDHPGRQAGSGASSFLGSVPGTAAKEFQIEVERLKAGAFLTAIDQLKGMGALSNAEGQTATAAVAALDPTGTEEGFLKRLAEYEEIVNRGLERARKRAKAPEGAATGGKRTLKWNPATESFE